MAPRRVRNLLALAVLSYLSRQPMHPYELARTLRENDDGRSIKFNHGSLYMVVGQLEKAGFVAAQGSDREGNRPERTVYAITDDGRAELHGWLRDNIYQHGRKFTSPELAERATGRPLHIAPYIEYLRGKYGELYAL